MNHYKIFHWAEPADCSVYVSCKANPTDAAVFLQFIGEELSGDDGFMLSNLAIANALVMFYDCKSGVRTPDAIDIEMGSERESRCGKWGTEYFSYCERDVSQLSAALKPHFYK